MEEIKSEKLVEAWSCGPAGYQEFGLSAWEKYDLIYVQNSLLCKLLCGEWTGEAEREARRPS